jgi:predicted metal-dependent peptidase
MTVKEYNLEKDIYHLLRDEPFFAVLSRQLDKRSTESIPTAGIKFNADRLQYELLYNPTFFAELPDHHKKWVLMHELYHASFGHTQNRTLEAYSRKVANHSMDLAINSLPNMTQNAPDFVLMPGRQPYQEIKLHGMASEWYANWIKNNPDKINENDDGDPQFDDHSDFGDSSGSDSDTEMAKQIASKKLQEALSKAVNECDKGSYSKGWGSVSSETRKKLRDIANSNFKLDPKKVLASFIKASVAADKKTSVTKRNRRLPGKKFGRKVQHRANIAISIDQSGSVSDELLGKVFTWLNDFAKFASFTVVPFDHEVFEERVYVWKKGQKRQRERVLCGGTDFNAPTTYVNKRNFDGHIIITDMLAPKPVKSKCQRMWLTDRYGSRYGTHKPKSERVLILD